MRFFTRSTRQDTRQDTSESHERSPAARTGATPHHERLDALRWLTVECPIRIDWLTGQVRDGDRKSGFKGSGQDYCDWRGYQPGDNIRRIYWKGVSKRPDRPMVTLFEEERNASIVVLVNVGDTMDGVSVGMSKRELACVLTASIMRSATRSRDMAAFTSFNRHGIVRKLGMRSASGLIRLAPAAVLEGERPWGLGAWLAAHDAEAGDTVQEGSSEAARAVLPVDGSQGTNPADSGPAPAPLTGLAEALMRLPQTRSLVFVLSDLDYELTNEDRDLLKVAAHKHEIVFLVVSDLRERELPDEPLLPYLPIPGFYPIVDQAGTTRMVFATKRRREEHRERFHSRQKQRFAELAELNCKFAAVHTEDTHDQRRMQLACILAGKRRGWDLNADVEVDERDSFSDNPEQERNQA